MGEPVPGSADAAAETMRRSGAHISAVTCRKGSVTAEPDVVAPAAPGPDAVDPHLLRSTVTVVVVSLVLGALTSWAQGVLPDAWAPLANSPSGWTAATALVVALTRPGLRRGAVFGVVSFVCLVLGYTLASRLGGLSYDPVLWGSVGVLAGPFVGAAAAATVSRRPPLVALGSGVLAGVLVADGIYGLTVVSDTTSPIYWTTALVAGLSLIVVAAGLRLRTVTSIALQVATLVVTTAVITVGYAGLNSLL